MRFGSGSYKARMGLGTWIILKWIFEKQDGEASIWLTTGIGGGSFEIF